MRYLVDPGLVRVGPVSWAFVIGLCALLPALAVLQHRSLLRGAMPAPTRRQVYGSAIVTHVVLVLAAAGLAFSAHIDLLPPYEWRAFDVAVGIVALATGLPLLSQRFRPDAIARERTRLIAPRARGDYALFYLMSVTAGISEQLAYRGALFAVLAALTRSWWLAAVLSAVAFGLVHVFQGWRSAGIVTLIGLRDQIVVGLTGTLVIAIVTHVVHDMIAGTILGRRVRREETSPRAHQA